MVCMHACGGPRGVWGCWGLIYRCGVVGFDNCILRCDLLEESGGRILFFFFLNTFLFGRVLQWMVEWVIHIYYSQWYVVIVSHVVTTTGMYIQFVIVCIEEKISRLAYALQEPIIPIEISHISLFSSGTIDP